VSWGSRSQSAAASATPCTPLLPSVSERFPPRQMRRTRCVYEGHLTGGSLALVVAPQLDDEPVPEETGAEGAPMDRQPTDLWTVDGGQAVGATPRALELVKQQQQRLVETQISAQRQRQEERRLEVDGGGLLMGMMGGAPSWEGADRQGGWPAETEAVTPFSLRRASERTVPPALLTPPRHSPEPDRRDQPATARMDCGVVNWGLQSALSDALKGARIDPLVSKQFPVRYTRYASIIIWRILQGNARGSWFG
jgi:hypothetical protein